MAWSLRLRSPPAAGESGQAKQRFVLALAAVGLTLGLLLAAVSVYAIWTNTTSVTPNFDSDTLDPGTGLIAFPSGSNIVISWTASVDTYAAGYKVLRSTTSGGPYTEIDTVTPIGATIYTDTSVVVDTTYYYVLQSYYQNWLSADSNQGSATAGAGLVSVADSYVQEDLAGSNFGTATLMDVQSYTAGQTTSLTSVADSYGQEDLADTNFGTTTSMDVQSDDDIVTTSFAAVADSYVQEDLADSSFGAATLMDVQTFQDGGSKENRRSLVQFDVSSIPAGSTVTAATLTLCAAVVPGSTRTHDVHRVTAVWDETVTWNNQPTVVPQKVSASTPATPACMTWTVTADVQLWVDGTANNGWRIEDANEGSNILHLAQYRTREESVVTAERPDLDVTYTAPTQQNRRSFVQFDVSSIPAGSNVNSATLTLCATAVPAATRTYDAYRVTAGWVEGTITWNNQPAVAGAATATNTTPATPGCMTWNIANDVQLWVDGTANDGWRIHDVSENSATQYLTQFRTKEDGAVPAEQPKLDVNYTEPLESVSEVVAAGGTVTTDTEADGATAADQLETWVTSPNAGTVTIIERAATPSPPPEFTFLGQEVIITAPNATAADPLVIKFRIDATLVPPGEDENTIDIFKDGVLVPNCDTFPGSTTAAPDPCVTDRVLLGDGDVEITVLTSTASGWNFGIPAPAVCSAGNTGFQSPTAQASDTGGDGNGFELNPTNAFADDAAFASNIDGQDDRHRFYGYDFSLASGCTIQGIEVRFDWWLDSISGTSSMDVELSWDGGTSWTQPRNDPLETDTEHTITFGGSIDLWGHAWSVSDLSSTNFRVRLTSNSTSTTRDFFVDWVPVNVYFGPTPSDTGYLSPSAEAADTGGDGDGFELNPTNAFADDAAFASSMDNSVDRHRFYNYGASIPAGSTISGIEVRLDWWMDDILGTNSMDVELSWDGGTSWTSAKIGASETTTEQTFSLGGPADTWARTWTDSEFSDANFRVRLTSNSSSGFRDFFLDWVAVRVYYTP
ncbi:MAG: DNRLRE domain-containing protein [Chloroflexi bacterium]|nr:DNRLRE domain-containing protein [Chloroflexota bacterium]